MIFRRLVALVLVLCALGTVLTPAAARAAEAPQTSVDTDNLEIVGTNGFGNLLSAEIAQSQDEAETEAGFGVSELMFSGSTATVTYSALREAILVVAVYTEDGLKLLCSGKTTVSPDGTTAAVTVQGNMPEYFYAGAYLLDVADYVPLCEEYTTPMYTREMRELLASTVDSYDPEKVYNLDDDKTTNFAVFAEETTVVREQPGMNTVVSADDEKKVYVIENADEMVTALQPGDVLAYPYGENEILIVKVASLSVSGTTVTITGTDLELDEAFSHVKMSGTTSHFEVDPSTADDCVTYVDTGVVPQGCNPQGIVGAEATVKIEEELKDNVKLTGSLTYAVELSVETYLTPSYKRLELKLEFNQRYALDVTGTFKPEKGISLGKLELPALPGVSVVMKAELNFEISGKLNIQLEVKTAVGAYAECIAGDWSLHYLWEAPDTDFDPELEGELFIGVTLTPAVEVLGGCLASAEIDGKIGVTFSAKQDLLSDFPNSERQHGCFGCIDGDVSFVYEVVPSITLLNNDDLRLEAKWLCSKVKFLDFYWSVDNGKAGWGTCPWIRYKTIIQVLDEQSAPVQGKNVYLMSTEQNATTDKNGIVAFYLSNGDHYAMVPFDAASVTMHIIVADESQKVIISEADHTRKPGGISGDVDSETIEDSANTAAPDVYLEDMVIANSGRYTGNQGDSFIDDLGTRNGTTDIHGNEMRHGLEAWIARWNFSAESSWAWVEYDLNNSYSKLVGKLSIVANSYNCTNFNSTIEIIGDGTVLYHSLLLPGMDVAPLSVDVTDVDTLRIYVYDNSPACGGTSFALWDFGLMKGDKDDTGPEGERTISIGDYIELGTYNDQPILWRCVAIDENGPLMLSDEILCFKSFDAKGEYGNYYRNKEGTNNWNDSALRHWLNSSGIVDWSNHISVPSENNVFNSFNAYDHEIGFLSSFTEDELKAIKQTTQKTYINGLDKDKADGGTKEFDPGNGSFSSILSNTEENTENGYFQFSTDWIFIPDLAQAEQIYKNLGAGYLIAQATNAAVEKDESNSSQVGTPQRYWLRVAENTGMSYECLLIVESTEEIGVMSALSVRNGSTFFSVGVRPAFYLNTDGDFTIISVGDQAGVTGTYNGHTYGIIHEVMPWSDAEVYCQQLGGHLATITSAEEQAFIESLNQARENLWIGGYQNDSGDWCWVTGEAWNYTNWGSGEPNDYGAVGPDENHLAMWPEQWNDLNNSNTIEQVGFVYELEPIAASTEETFAASFTDNLAIDRQPAEEVSPDAIFGGDYSTEVTNTYTLKTASFTGLVPGEEYVLLALVNLEAEDILAANNLLAILQGTAAADGTLKFRYVQRVDTDTSYVFACGASNKNLADAEITFSEMTATGELQVVTPTVVYDGETLVEGVDYEITGAVSFTEPGIYTCTIRGIRNYTGTVECTYTVGSGALLGDVDGNGEVDTTDAYLIVMYYNEKSDLDENQLMAADVDGSGEVDTTDAYYIVMHYNEKIDSFPAQQ